MTIRSAIFLVGFAVAITVAKGDEPAKSAVAGRVIQGTVVTAGGKPLEGARVLIGEFGSGMSFVDDAAAATDARGEYRLSLGQFPWAKGALRVLVLAQGFEIGDRKLEPGIATADFQLAAQPWKETLVRLEDESGKPVAGVEVGCLLVQRPGAAEVRSRRVHPARDGTGALGHLGRETRWRAPNRDAFCG